MEFGYFIISIAWSLIWGFATAGVRDRKGYGRRWFWFGFFLGLIPFIIACAIPEKKYDVDSVTPGELNRTLAANGGSEPHQSVFANQNYVQNTVSGGGWQCSCGRANPTYVSTCTCGLNKRQVVTPATDISATQES